MAPNEVSPTLLNSVTFNEDITSNMNFEISNNNKRINCESSGEGYDDATYTLTFNIETIQYSNYKDIWGNNYEIFYHKQTGAYHLVDKANLANINNYSNGNIHEMYTFDHPATEQTPALTDYRYIGNDPYNYVYFNCDSMENQNSETCEVWRIVGVFSVDDGTGNFETRIKLVRNRDFDLVHGASDWTDSWLQRYLNEDYYNRVGDYSATNYGLKESARNLIGDAVYYLGSFNFSSSLTAEKLYLLERGNTTCSYCNGNTSKLKWIGKIASLYPSDEFMAYGKGYHDGCYNTPGVRSNCYQTNFDVWIYDSSQYDYWLLSSSSGSNNVFITFGGTLKYESAGYDTYALRPTFYLKADIKIIDGTGEQNNPYKLSV